MAMRNWMIRNGMLMLGSMAFLVVSIVLGSIVFSPAEHLEGVIIEKVFVPAKAVVGAHPLGKRPYSVTVEAEAQWIAIVKTDRGDTLKVHMHPSHYGKKEVGDRMKFREYEGGLIHIDYFAHGDEEGVEGKAPKE